jgi:hypothetical protein
LSKADNPYFVIHQLDPDKVAEHVTERLEKFARWRDELIAYWQGDEHFKLHESAAHLSYYRRVNEEFTRYINVYIQQYGVREFRLKYERGGSDGTGPFTSRKKAEDWFLNGGR